MQWYSVIRSTPKLILKHFGNLFQDPVGFQCIASLSSGSEVLSRNPFYLKTHYSGDASQIPPPDISKPFRNVSKKISVEKTSSSLFVRVFCALWFAFWISALFSKYKSQILIGTRYFFKYSLSDRTDQDPDPLFENGLQSKGRLIGTLQGQRAPSIATKSPHHHLDSS